MARRVRRGAMPGPAVAEGVAAADMPEMEAADVPHAEDERQNRHAQADEKADEKQGLHVRPPLRNAEMRIASLLLYARVYRPVPFCSVSNRNVHNGACGARRIDSGIGAILIRQRHRSCATAGGKRRSGTQCLPPSTPLRTLPHRPWPALTVGRVMLLTAAALVGHLHRQSAAESDRSALPAPDRYPARHRDRPARAPPAPDSA